MCYILVINIGSTSTKVGFYKEPDFLFRETIDPTSEQMAGLNDFDKWLKFHKRAVDGILESHGEEIKHLDIAVSRGGLTRPIKTGAYRITESMLKDLRSGNYGWHPCNVGPAIAYEIANRFKAKAIIYDSPVSDEMIPIARFTGLKGVKRRAAFHVLSQKSAARKAASDLKLSYSKSSFIVAHMGGGITICAHKNCIIIYGSHCINEGPFSPQRTGTLPLQDLITLCFSGQFTQKEINLKLFGQGGVHSYLGTHDIAAVENRISRGDAEAERVLRAMGYQISKDICSMAAVLEGKADVVVLTGNLCKADTVTNEIRNRVNSLSPVLIYTGEDELKSLAEGGLGVLRSFETIRIYE